MFFCFLLIFQDVVDNDLSDEGDELDFDNDDDNDDEVDEFVFSFYDVEVCSIFNIFLYVVIVLMLYW